MRLLHRLARARPVRALLAWMLTHMSSALPLERLHETETLLAFRHPQPARPFHVLIVPRREIASFADLQPVRDAAFLADLVSVVQNLVAEFGLPAYRLIVNGGEYQEFPHLHFHLVSDSPAPPAGGKGRG